MRGFLVIVLGLLSCANVASVFALSSSINHATHVLHSEFRGDSSLTEFALSDCESWVFGVLGLSFLCLLTSALLAVMILRKRPNAVTPN